VVALHVVRGLHTRSLKADGARLSYCVTALHVASGLHTRSVVGVAGWLSYCVVALHTTLLSPHTRLLVKVGGATCTSGLLQGVTEAHPAADVGVGAAVTNWRHTLQSSHTLSGSVV
jgi:hypothetical protein